MINISIDIQLPILWKKERFTKNNWGGINLIVGPNGTGKSLFSEQLKVQLISNGYKVRLLNAERLSGLEKQNYSYYGNSGLNEGLNISHFPQLKSQGESYGLSSSLSANMSETLAPLGISVGRWRVSTHDSGEGLDGIR